MSRVLRFDEAESLRWTVGGLLTTISGLLIFIKNYAVKAIKNRNDNIEKRLVALEKGQTKLMEKLTIVNHKLDNYDTTEASTLQLILDILERMEKS